jgi:carbamoyltransferase
VTSAVLGVNAFHGDASAAAVAGGALVAAVAEERFVRVKHWAGFPKAAIGYALREAAGGDWGGVRAVAVARRPRAYLARKAWLALRNWRALPRTLARVRNLRAVASLGDRLAAEFGLGDRAPEVHAVEHHVAHVASAYYCSPWDEALCLTMDGFGDFVSSMAAVGRGSRIEVLDRVCYPHSAGLFYTALTQHLGFPRYGDEYKVMGLAAYGEPRFADDLRRVLRPAGRGRFALDLSYFRHVREGVEMTWEGGEPALGPVASERLAGLVGPARRPDEALEPRHRDLAASVQAVYEETFFDFVRHWVGRTGLRRVCLAGGCAQNSLANGRVYERAGVEALFVQPAAGDDGTALGAAQYVEHATFGHPRSFALEHAYWGPGHDERAVRAALAGRLPGSGGRDGVHDGLVVSRAPDEATLCRETARAIASGEVVGWYQGRGEWGPRALGNRSILADPRSPSMREVLNVKVKRREPFRPFAPSVLEERLAEWFEGASPDPFMTQVFPVRPDRRDRVPAIVHADGTGRVQTVSRRGNPRYRALLEAFEVETGVPMLLNTSFNESEPIVDEPAQALDCFLRTRMDRLVLGDVVVRRAP